jgi:Icc-related predicted phosphoesterase
MTKSLSPLFARLGQQLERRNTNPKTGRVLTGRPKKAAKAAAQHRPLASAVRILAVSDIHNNVACVRKLRAQEEDNSFDVIAIAGDIGKNRADDIFEVLKSFNCPIVYVDGNHDDRSATRSAALKSGGHPAHLNFVPVGPLNFTGFSFMEPKTSQLTDADCLDNLRDQFDAANVDPSSTIFITHDRVGLSRRFPNLLLHLYGHIHTFEVLRRGTTTCVNSSALDRILPVIPKSLTPKAASSADVRHANHGNYAVIEVGRERDILVECRLLRRQYANWTPLDNSWLVGRHGGPLLIDEEACFGDNVRKRAADGG